MKKLLSTIILSLFCVTLAKGQVPTIVAEEPIIGMDGVFKVSFEFPIIDLPELDTVTLLYEDSVRYASGEPMPFKFAHAIDVNLNFEHGAWTSVEGGRVWKIKIKSENALSLSLIFDRFLLPEGAVMYLYDDTYKIVQGPISHKQNKESNTYATSIIFNNNVIIEYFEPHNSESLFNISKVAIGYASFHGDHGTSAPCNNDIKCHLGDPWCIQARSVALFLLDDNQFKCSAVLINNERTDYRPFILSAEHCIDGDNNNWVFVFHYKNTACNSGTYTGTTWSFTGATIRAKRDESGSDFALFELDNFNPNDKVTQHSGVHFAGWSRDINNISSTTGIHHPKGDVMKISVDYSPPIISGRVLIPCSLLNIIGPYNYWHAIFDDGIIEGGSSGSPLFNNEQRIIGQARSSCINCEFIGPAVYGRFDVSWGNGSNATERLREWLDPDDNDPMNTDALSLPIPFHNRTVTGGHHMFAATHDMELAGFVNNPLYNNLGVLPPNNVQFTVEPNAEVAYLAGTKIQILPGVHVKHGSHFVAQIGTYQCPLNLDFRYKVGTPEEQPVDTQHTDRQPELFNDEFTISIMPNPFREFTTIKLKLPSNTLQIEGILITEVNGKLVTKLPVPVVQDNVAILEIDNTLAPGMYFLHVITNEGIKYRKMISL